MSNENLMEEMAQVDMVCAALILYLTSEKKRHTAGLAQLLYKDHTRTQGPITSTKDFGNKKKGSGRGTVTCLNTFLLDMIEGLSTEMEQMDANKWQIKHNMHEGDE